MRLRWLQPLCSQHGYCYLGRRGTQKKANLHTTWKRQSQNSAWAVWFHHHLTNCFSRKTWVSFCLDQQPIGLFFPCLSPDKHPLHLTGDSQKGVRLLPRISEKLKASICLHTQGSPARRWAAQDHTWPCSASRQAGRCPRGLTAPASNRTSIMERRVP